MLFIIIGNLFIKILKRAKILENLFDSVYKKLLHQFDVSFFHCVNPSSRGKEHDLSVVSPVSIVRGGPTCQVEGADRFHGDSSEFANGTRTNRLTRPCLFAWLTASKTSQPMRRIHMHLRSCHPRARIYPGKNTTKYTPAIINLDLFFIDSFDYLSCKCVNRAVLSNQLSLVKRKRKTKKKKKKDSPNNSNELPTSSNSRNHVSRTDSPAGITIC